MKKELEFDFQSPLKKIAQKAERQSYKHLLFLALGISILTPLSFHIIRSVDNHYAKIDQIKAEKFQNQISIIQKMTPQKFQQFTQYLSLNLNNYDAQSNLLETAIQQASIANNRHSMDIGNATNIEQSVQSFQDRLKADIVQIIQTKRNIDAHLPVKEKNIQLFLKYLSFYQSHLSISDTDINYRIQQDLNVNYSGNITYYQKNDIFHKIQVLDNQLNQKFIVQNPPPSTENPNTKKKTLKP